MMLIMEIGNSIPPQFIQDLDTIIAGSMIVKLNSKNNVQAKGIFHPLEVHWLANPNNSLYVHVDPGKIKEKYGC